MQKRDWLLLTLQWHRPAFHFMPSSLLLLLLCVPLASAIPHSHACLPGFDKFTFCDTALPIQARVDALVGMMTLSEKISLVQDGQPAVPRLGLDFWNWNLEGKTMHFSVGTGVSQSNADIVCVCAHLQGCMASGASASTATAPPCSPRPLLSARMCPRVLRFCRSVSCGL